MKKLKLLGIILTISCSSFSQGLTPIVQELNDDTIFCFTISQSKVIAQRIEANEWCDSITIAQDELIMLFDQTIEVNDSVVGSLEQKMRHMEQISHNQEMSMVLLNKTINVQERKLKRSKTHKLLMGVGLGIMTVLVIKN